MKKTPTPMSDKPLQNRDDNQGSIFRLPPGLSKRVSEAATRARKSQQDWIEEVIQQALSKL